MLSSRARLAACLRRATRRYTHSAGRGLEPQARASSLTPLQARARGGSPADLWRASLPRSSGLDDAKRLADAAGPWRAVSGEHQGRFDAAEPRERRVGPGNIGPESRDLRSGRAGEHIQRGDRVSDEEGVTRRYMERRAAFAVSRYVDHAWRSRDVERRAVAERRDFEDRCRAQEAVRDREGEKAQDRERPRSRERLVLRGHLATGEARVELVHAHRGARFPA